MNKYSERSLSRLETCDERIQRVFKEVLKVFDHTVLCGHRGKEDQETAFREGRSQVRFPNSKHNSNPSIAIDVAPYPIDWNDRERFTLFAGYVLGTANSMGIKLRWGGDWDKDTQVNDNNFDDLPHFELVEDAA